MKKSGLTFNLRTLFMAFGVLFGVAMVAIWWSGRPDYDLRSMPDDEPYTSTKFEFRYGSRIRVIEDPENHLRFGYGELPDAILVTEGRRLVIFDSQKAVIKSQTDSIDVFPNSVSHKGYLGVRDTGADYVVDSRGQLQPK